MPTTPPTLEDLEALARKGMKTIPDDLRARTDGVVFVVEEFPSDDVCRDMELDSPFDLLGLYSGLPFGQKQLGAQPEDVDMIFLYRRPILDHWCETGEDLEHIVTHVLVHEIGHHFGLSDEDMERIENTPRTDPLPPLR